MYEYINLLQVDVEIILPRPFNNVLMGNWNTTIYLATKDAKLMRLNWKHLFDNSPVIAILLN